MRIFTLVLAILFAYTGVNAQCPGCTTTIPASVPADTIYLSPIPDGTQFVPYAEDLSFRLPTNANQVDPANPSLTIYNIRITAVSGLPFGLEWETSQSADGNKYDLPAEKDGCVRLCGTPLQYGTFNVNVTAIGNVQLVGNQTFNIPLQMTVNQGASSNNGFTANPNGGCTPLTVAFTNNNPSNGRSGYTYNWNFGNGYTTSDENPIAQTYNTPGDYIVNYTATIDTTPYLLNSIVVNSCSCNDPFDGADLYLILKNASGTQIYNSFPGTSNTGAPYTFNFSPPIALANANYSFEVWDEDLNNALNPNDLCGTVTFNGHSATNTVTVNGPDGPMNVTYNIFHLVSTITSSDTIHVYASPSQPSVTTIGADAAGNFCDGDSVRLTSSISTNVQWYLNDTTLILGATNPIYTVYASGKYSVRTTNVYGCYSVSSPVTLTKRDRPYNPSYTQTGNRLQLIQAYAGETYQWYLNGTLINGAVGTSYNITQNGLYEVVATNQYGCKARFGYYVLFTGIDEHGILQSVSIYPNPVHDVLNIKMEDALTENTRFVITSTNGKVVSQGLLNNTISMIDVADFSNGIYFIEIRNSAGVQRVRFYKN